jgi:hypothetical protein
VRAGLIVGLTVVFTVASDSLPYVCAQPAAAANAQKKTPTIADFTIDPPY